MERPTDQPTDHPTAQAAPPRLTKARRDAFILGILVAAVLLLIWNGSTFLRMLRLTGQLGPQVQTMMTALTLNFALVLFGWRRYVDMQHEAEISALKEQRAVQMASLDAVTGLANRKGFSDRSESLCAAAPAGWGCTLISVQMTRFKTINEQHGYEIGDRLLQLVANELAEAAGERGFAARLSGDEFVIVLTLPNDDRRAAEQVAEDVLRRVCRPYPIEERIVEVGAFAGIASGPAGSIRLPDLLHRAEIAMNHAQSGRVGRPVWFDSGMERALIAHGEIEQGIRYGLEHAQFIPYFEPQVDLMTGRIVGFEVLSRWNHPLSGIIGPDTFIPIAEEAGLIGPLSERVIREALREAVGWDPSIHISVNISPRQFADGWFAQRIVRLLAETGFPANRLVIELTESALYPDLELARSLIRSLKNQGVRIALDDFGTGNAGLAHLRSLPFDLIKIDRSFVRDTPALDENAAIIRAVNAMANALDVPVCVEGIENEAAHDAVVRLGCQLGQGWYFGKPMPAYDARSLVASLDRNSDAAPGALAV